MALVVRREVGADHFPLFAQLDLDSLGIVEFAMVAEKEFGVVLAEDEVSPKARVAEAVALLAAKGVGDG